MKDAAYLLATLDQLQHITKIDKISSTEINGDLWIKYSTQTKDNVVNWNAFNVATLAKKLRFDWCELKPRVLCYLAATNQDITLPEEIHHHCYLALKHEIEDKIQFAELTLDKLKYRRSGTVYTKDIQLCPDVVLGAEGLLDGLHVIDYAGSHHTVVTPAKKEHLTTASTCSCSEFSKLRRCGHTKLVKLLLTQRRTFMQNGVLTVRY